MATPRKTKEEKDFNKAVRAAEREAKAKAESESVENLEQLNTTENPESTANAEAPAPVEQKKPEETPATAPEANNVKGLNDLYDQDLSENNVINPNRTQSVTNLKAPVKDQEYLKAYARYINTFFAMPNELLSTDQLNQLVTDAEKSKEAENPAPVETKTDPAAGETETEDFDSERFVMAQRGKEKKKFTRITWNLLKNSRDGWTEIVQPPKEVQKMKGK